MRRLLAFFTFFALPILAGCTSGGGSPDTNACGTLGLNTRVANGTECSTHGSPVVQLTVLPVEGGVGVCSGTLLTARHVLTAAHCFNFRKGVASASVRVGTSDIPVSAFDLHPAVNFETIPIQNDVAIAILAIPANAPTLPIILSRGIEPNDVVGIFGFGNNESEIDGVLRSGEMRIAGINSQFFSAQFVQKGRGSNVCPGDSGGPAVIRTNDGSGVVGVVGITSFGTRTRCGNDGISAFMNAQSVAVLGFITEHAPGVAVR